MSQLRILPTIGPNTWRGGKNGKKKEKNDREGIGTMVAKKGCGSRHRGNEKGTLVRGDE
jgi:hypothetical protein